MHDINSKIQTEHRWEVFPPVSIPFGFMAVRVATMLPVAIRGIIVMFLSRRNSCRLIISIFIAYLSLCPLLAQTIWEGYDGVSNDSLIAQFKETMGYKIQKKDFFSLSINHQSIGKLINANESINIDSIKTVIVYDNSTTKCSLSEGFTDKIEQTYLHYQYNVVERSNINVLLAEQGLSQSGLLSESSIIESGRILGADAVIITKVIKNINFITFRIKFVEIRSSIVLYSSTFVESIRTEEFDIMEGGTLFVAKPGVKNWLGFYSNWLPYIVTIKCILINRGLMW